MAIIYGCLSLMKKYLLIFLLILIPMHLSASNEVPDSGNDLDLKKEPGKVYIKEGEEYPFMTVEQNPSVYAVRGFITGDINEKGLISSMTKLAKEYNLAGWIRKSPEGGYQFHLQGLPDNVKAAVAGIPGCDPSSKIVDVDSRVAVVTKYLKTFRKIESENH